MPDQEFLRADAIRDVRRLFDTMTARGEDTLAALEPAAAAAADVIATAGIDPRFVSRTPDLPRAPTPAELAALPAGHQLAGSYRPDGVQLLVWSRTAASWQAQGDALATAPAVEAAQQTADTARTALGNLTLAALSARPRSAGPQLADGSRWMPRAIGTPNGGTIVAAADGGVWAREYNGAVNARWFGAKGDGMTDDSAALQAAIDAVWAEYAAGGGDLFIPRGRYVVGSTLIWRDRVNLLAEGTSDFRGVERPYSVSFIATDTLRDSGNPVIKEDPYFPVQNYVAHRMEGIAYLASRVDETTRRGIAVRTRHQGGKIYRCAVINFDRGFYLDSTGVQVIDCDGAYCDDTVFVANSECYIANLTDAPNRRSIHLFSGDGARVVDCKLFGDGSTVSEYAIVVRTSMNTISGNYLDQFHFSGMLLDNRFNNDEIVQNTITANVFYANGTALGEYDLPTQRFGSHITLKTAGGVVAGGAPSAGGGTIHHNTIVGNSFAQHGGKTINGVLMWADNDAQIHDNAITGNTFSQLIPYPVRNVGADLHQQTISGNAGLANRVMKKQYAVDGSQIPHGMIAAPRIVQVMPTQAGRCVGVNAIDATTFTLTLTDAAGAPVVEGEEIYWMGEL